MTSDLHNLALQTDQFISRVGLFASINNQVLLNSNSSNNAAVPTISRPWIEPPEGSLPYDQQDGIALPVAAGWTLVSTITIPEGYDGVLNYIACNFTGGGFVQFSGDIVWQLRKGGVPVRNFDFIKNEKGTLAIPRLISPLRVYSQQKLEWYVNHVANVALNGSVVCTLNGYFYPRQV